MDSITSKEDKDNRFIGYLSNFEVYQFMKSLKESGQATPLEWKLPKHPDAYGPKPNSNMPTLIYEALQYFQSSPCISQSTEAIYEFVRKLEPYKLTKPEKLCILNTRPTKPLDIQAIVEESEERLTEEQIDEILNIVEETLPPPPDPSSSSSMTASATTSSTTPTSPKKNFSFQ